MSETSIQFHPLIDDHENVGVQQVMCFFPPAQRVYTAGRLIMHPEDEAKKAQKLVVVGHGLPGVEWRKRTEAHLRRVIGANRGMMALVLIAPGLSATQENWNLTPADLEHCQRKGSEFFKQRLSLASYIRSYAAVLGQVRALVGEQTHVQAIGHSYGAIALIHALDDCIKKGIPLPDAVAFLAPFVKCSLDEEDHYYSADALDISNSAVTGEASLPKKTQVEILRRVLKECLESYQCTETDLLLQHRNSLGRGFYGRLRDLKPVTASGRKVRITLGGKDHYISSEHADWIQKRMGTAVQIETLADDDHQLGHLNWGALLAA